MGIQSNITQGINTAIASAVAGQYLKTQKEEQKMSKKYSTTGKLGTEVLQKSGLKTTSPEIETKLAQGLEPMKAEALRTDRLEREARFLNLFPTAKSKAIRAEGLQRREANIAELAGKLTAIEATEKAAQNLYDGGKLRRKFIKGGH